jgi:phage shock protein C
MRKKLKRSSNDVIIAGVCAGIADHLNIDPILIRILFVILAIGSLGALILIYLILWIIIPEKKKTK